MAKAPHIDRVTFDRYTLAHVGIGAGYGVLGAPWWLALLLTLGWEAIEDPLKRIRPSWFYVDPETGQPRFDTMRNRLGDVAGVMAGWSAVRILSRQKRP